RLSAYILTLNPAGTCSCAASGFGITRAELLADGVAKGCGSVGNCAAAALQIAAISRRKGTRGTLIGFAPCSLNCIVRNRTRAEARDYILGLPLDPMTPENSISSSSSFAF